jgi:hypothetical protein
MTEDDTLIPSDEEGENSELAVLDPESAALVAPEEVEAVPLDTDEESIPEVDALEKDEKPKGGHYKQADIDRDLEFEELFDKGSI